VTAGSGGTVMLASGGFLLARRLRARPHLWNERG
jgi:hypothetical protein